MSPSMACDCASQSGCPGIHFPAQDSKSVGGDAISAPRSGDVCRHLHYFSAPANNEKPMFRVTEANGVGFKNYPCVNHRVLIRDVRAHPARQPFHLSTESFQLLQHILPPSTGEPSYDTAMERTYTEAAAKLALAHVVGAERVTVFDHTVRRASAELKLNRPVRKVHVDQSAKAAILRARRHLDPEDAQAVEAGQLRLRIINVWRPLIGPVMNHPLCLAESASVPEKDLVEVDHVYDDRVGQTYAVKPQSAQELAESPHRFWYLGFQDVTDVWLIQCFDAKLDAEERQLRCPHASFEFFEGGGSICCGRSPDKIEGRSRASIEVRCLVLGG